MTTSTVTPEIAAFAHGVRAALADLPAQEVDDLTEGLEADLSEAYAEDLQRELPDPSAYATELRAAAGLPVRSKVKAGVLAGIGDSLRNTRRDTGITIRRNPTLAGIADFLLTLRPVWWIVRAWLAVWLISAFFGAEDGILPGLGGWLLLLIVAGLISVQWGRGHWHADRVSALIVLGNVVAVVALLPVLAAAHDWRGSDYGTGYVDGVNGVNGAGVGAPEKSLGVTLDGASVTNIFAYGADGKALTNVQLFDQDGRPLVTHLDPIRDECGDGAQCEFSAPDGLTAAPTQLETGASVRNVFPLSFIKGLIDGMTGEVSDDPQAVPTPATAPFVKVPGVMPAPKVAESNQ